VIYNWTWGLPEHRKGTSIGFDYSFNLDTSIVDRKTDLASQTAPYYLRELLPFLIKDWEILLSDSRSCRQSRRVLLVPLSVTSLPSKSHSISVMFFFIATNATQDLADYFVLALISDNGSHPRTTDLFEMNRQVLCMYVSEWPNHVRSDSLSRGLFFSVDSRDELGQCRHITPHESFQIRGPERVKTKHTNSRDGRGKGKQSSYE